MKITSKLTSILLSLAPVLLALLFTTLILTAVGAPAWEAYHRRCDMHRFAISMA